MDSIQHIVFKKLREVVRCYHNRPYDSVYEGDFVTFSIVDIVSHLVNYCIKAIVGVSYIPYGEEAPFVSLCRCNGRGLEKGGI